MVFDNKVDFPTDGKPIIHTRASESKLSTVLRKKQSKVSNIPPDFKTSKPSPLADFFSGSRSWALYLATR